MLSQFCSRPGRGPATTGDNAVPDPTDNAAAADPARLAGDEVERLIELCEAPALLWQPEPAPARAPEPFGMIA